MDTLKNRAIEATARFLECRSYEIVDRPQDGEADIVARDAQEDALVFVEVKAHTSPGSGFPEAEVSDRAKREAGALTWLQSHPETVDTTVRFDKVDLLIVASDRALVRHHINCLAVAC